MVDVLSVVDGEDSGDADLVTVVGGQPELVASPWP